MPWVQFTSAPYGQKETSVSVLSSGSLHRTRLRTESRREEGSSSDRTVNILRVPVSIPISQIISKPREYTEDEGKELSIP